MIKSKNWPGDPLAVLARLAALTALAAQLTGCAGHRAEVVPRAAEGPAMDLAQGLYLRSENLRTLAARGAISHEAGRRTFFRFEVLLLKPDRLLFTAFDPTGRPAFRLAAAEGRLTGLLYGARQYFTGPATAENFARFLSLNLTLEQLVALLSNATARPAAAGARALGDNTELTLVPAEAPEDEKEVWRLKLGGGLDQDPEQAVILAAARGQVNRPDLDIRYLTVQNMPREDKPGVLTPFPTSVEAQWVKQSLRLTYEEVSLGPKLDPTLFVLAPPEDFEVVFLP